MTTSVINSDDGLVSGTSGLKTTGGVIFASKD